MARREQELAEIVDRMAQRHRDALMRALAPFNEAAATDLSPAGLPGVSRDPLRAEWGI